MLTEIQQMHLLDTELQVNNRFTKNQNIGIQIVNVQRVVVHRNVQR